MEEKEASQAQGWRDGGGRGPGWMPASRPCWGAPPRQLPFSLRSDRSAGVCGSRGAGVGENKGVC